MSIAASTKPPVRVDDEATAIVTSARTTPLHHIPTGSPPQPRWSGPLNCPAEQGFFGLSRLEGPARGFTLKVSRDGRQLTVEVRADGEGVVSHAGAALLAEAADRLALTGALSGGLAAMRQRRGGHEPGRGGRDLAGVVAGRGGCPFHPRGGRGPPPVVW